MIRVDQQQVRTSQQTAAGAWKREPTFRGKSPKRMDIPVEAVAQDEKNRAATRFPSRLRLARKTRLTWATSSRISISSLPSDAAINLNLREKNVVNVEDTDPARGKKSSGCALVLDDGNDHTLEEVGPNVRGYARTHPPD